MKLWDTHSLLLQCKQEYHQNFGFLLGIGHIQVYPLDKSKTKFAGHHDLLSSRLSLRLPLFLLTESGPKRSKSHSQASKARQTGTVSMYLYYNPLNKMKQLDSDYMSSFWKNNATSVPSGCCRPQSKICVFYYIIEIAMFYHSYIDI